MSYGILDVGLVNFRVFYVKTENIKILHNEKPIRAFRKGEKLCDNLN